MTEDSPHVVESTQESVYEAAVRLLEERRAGEGFSTVDQWVTCTEIANVTGIDKSEVAVALEALGNGRLHVRQSAGKEIEVVGVDHQGAASDTRGDATDTQSAATYGDGSTNDAGVPEDGLGRDI